MLEPFLASFTGTAVEFFETLAIAYAIFRAGYPREALSALLAGHLLVLLMAVFLFPLFSLFPIFWMQLVAALLLTAMGLHWTLKSARRLHAHQRPRWAEDPLGKVNIAPLESPSTTFSVFVFLVMFKSSLIEAAEIVLVVTPVAAASAAWAAVLWGIAAGITAVSLMACVLHGQLKKVPEVKLKLAVGVVLSFLGISWLLELFQLS